MDDNFTTWEQQFLSNFTSYIISHLAWASCDFWRHAATIFGIGDSYPWKLQEALLGGESKLSRLHFSMIHDINSPPRHQDDIGATLDDTFFIWTLQLFLWRSYCSPFQYCHMIFSHADHYTSDPANSHWLHHGSSGMSPGFMVEPQTRPVQIIWLHHEARNGTRNEARNGARDTCKTQS